MSTVSRSAWNRKKEWLLQVLSALWPASRVALPGQFLIFLVPFVFQAIGFNNIASALLAVWASVLNLF